MDEKTQIVYGIIGCCVGIALGFAIGFPIFYLLPYEKRGYIGVPFMLMLNLTTCIVGGIIGVKMVKAKEREQQEMDDF